MNRPLLSRTMSGVQAGARPFRIGRATVDPISRDVAWPAGQERLQPQTLKVLVTLASRSGEVVTRDELVQLCWDGRIVGEDVINRSISLLRHLADRVGGFAIETVPRTGYRLVERQAHRRRIWLWIAAALAIALAAGLAVWVALRPAPVSQGAPPAPVVTVVPFSADSDDPVARQVAQAAPVSVSHMLSASGFPIVLAAASSRQAANSDFIISGNVSRSGGALAATVQMTGTRDGAMVFSHDFAAPVARSADLPDQIGAAVSAVLAWTGAEMVLDRRHPLDPQVESELMTAMTLTIEQHDSLRAYQLSRHVASLAPNSAIAQLSLAVATAFSIGSIPPDDRAEAVARAKAASERAQALAPEFGDVYIMACMLRSPVRMRECDERLRSAIRIDPNTSFVPGYLSALLYNAGRIDESLQLARVSLANDPYKPAKLARMIRMLEVSGSGDEAERLFNEASRLWPDTGRMRSARLLGMAEAGNYAAMGRFADPAADADMLDVAPLHELLAARQERNLPRARRICSGELKPFTRSLCMTTLADLGDLDGSYAIARDLYPAFAAPAGTDEDRLWMAHPDGFATAVLNGPAGRSMRTDPRFLALAQKLGLLEYWRATRAPDFCTKLHEPVCRAILRR